MPISIAAQKPQADVNVQSPTAAGSQQSDTKNDDSGSMEPPAGNE